MPVHGCINADDKNGLTEYSMLLGEQLITISKEEVIKSVKSVIKSLKEKDKLKIYLDKLIEDIYYELIRQKDSRAIKINDFINKKFSFSYTTNELIKEYKNINIDNLIEFINRLKLDTIYFLRGEFNEDK